MKSLFSILFIFFSFISYSQITFQEGYLITNTGEKIECLIQNEEWLLSPDNIYYKFSESSEVYEANVKEFKEFYIYNTEFKYIQATVKVNLGLQTQHLEWRNVFLKCILQGEASLFEFRSRQYWAFYLRLADRDFIPLMNNVDVEGESDTRNIGRFKQQIFNTLKCSSIGKHNIKTLKYNQNDLKRIVKRYNDCKGSESKTFEEYHEKDVFYFSAYGGSSFFEVGKDDISRDDQGIQMRSSSSIVLGGEVEYRLNQNDYKWGLFTGLNFSKNSFTGTYSKHERINNYFTKLYGTFEGEYTSLRIPMGLRYYSYLNTKNLISYDIACAYNIMLENEVISSYKYESTNSLGFILGLGYNYNNKGGVKVSFNYGKIIKIRSTSGFSKSLSVQLFYSI